MNTTKTKFKPGDRVKIDWLGISDLRPTGTVDKVANDYVGFMVDGYTYKNGDRHSFSGENINRLSHLNETKVMNNKPFDLQKALAGDLVIINGATGQYQFTYTNDRGAICVFKMTEPNQKEWIAMINDNGMSVSDAIYTIATMAPKPDEYWVATGIHAEAGIIVAGRAAETSAQAVDYLSSISFVESDSIQTHKITRYE